MSRRLARALAATPEELAAKTPTPEATALKPSPALPHPEPASPHPSGHIFDPTGSFCLTCGWEFRQMRVATGRDNAGKETSLPSYQFRQGPNEVWTPIMQNPEHPPRWPKCCGAKDSQWP